MNKHNPIDYNDIEAIALNSDNPAFRSVRFRRAIIAFRRFGLRPKKKAEWTLTDALYYAKNSFMIYETMQKCTE